VIGSLRASRPSFGFTLFTLGQAGNSMTGKCLMAGVQMKLLSVLLAFAFLVTALAVAAMAQTKPAPVKIVPSNLFEELEKKVTVEPNIQPATLAKYGNDLLARKGLDFQFDLCEFLAKNNRTPPSRLASKARSYKLPMTQTDGRRVIFETRLDSEGGSGPCGECFVSIPVTRVTAKEIELVAGGKKYVVVRPNSFLLDEVDLVDQSMRKVLRTWHYNGVPWSVSSDGTKLYFEIYFENGIAGVVLELSETGAMRILPRDELKLPQGEEMKSIRPIQRTPIWDFCGFASAARV